MRSRGLAWQDHDMAGEAGSAGHQDIRLGLVGRHPAQAGGSLAAKVAEVGGEERAARSSAEVVMAGGPIRERDEMRGRGP